MNCPKCRQRPLREKYISAVNLNVDYCHRCQGIWFDGGELERAMPVADPQLQIPRNAVRLLVPCPGAPSPFTCSRIPRRA